MSCPMVLSDGSIEVSIRHSAYATKHAKYTAVMLSSWFPDTPLLRVSDVYDDSSDWNFEISINGVIVHSRDVQWHGFLHDDWNQQRLIWNAINGVVKGYPSTDA